jgi:hypothetical protein
MDEDPAHGDEAIHGCLKVGHAAPNRTMVNRIFDKPAVWKLEQQTMTRSFLQAGVDPPKNDLDDDAYCRRSARPWPLWRRKANRTFFSRCRKLQP